MEKEKYYTPTIEEFHVGFEVEWSEFGRKIWSEVIIDEHDLIELFTGEEKIEHFRVKHLDREDIESFGFDFIVSYEINSHYTKPYLFRGDNTELSIVNNSVNNWTMISIKRQGVSSSIFCGYIKNKSEFSRLLKQLSII